MKIMKKIENKLTNTNVRIDINDESKGFKKGRYSDIIIIAMKHPRKSGFDYDSMLSTKRVIDVCENSSEKDELIMEDADMDYMRSIVEPFVWGEYNEDIIEMTMLIKAPKTIN